MEPIDPTTWDRLAGKRTLPHDDWKVVLGLLGALIFTAFALGFLSGRAWA